MHFIVHALDFVNEIATIVRIVNDHVVLLRLLLLLEGFEETMSTILIHMPMGRQVVHNSLDEF
jgi:hypothetical protein